MNKHICVLFCYNNYDHIKSCFESLYDDNIDFFIIENHSINSKLISEFFLEQKLKGYIQFEKNITNKAVSIFIKEYLETLKQYEYITISDCDLTVLNSKDTFDEIKKNLELEDVAVCCVDLDMCNLPNIPNNEHWVPTTRRITDEYIDGDSGVHLMTIKKENLNLLEVENFIDFELRARTFSINKKWVRTLKNKAYHLTWDLYFTGNEYFEYKKSKYHELWSHNRTCEYKMLK